MTAFWVLAPIMVLAALGILFVRKAVHAALLLAVVMISLAMLYAVLEAPFLFVVQIIVYTGAILMLFLFVLMLVGVDASDSVVETIKGQRLMAWVTGLVFAVVMVVGLTQLTFGTAVGLDDANRGGNVQALANLLFLGFSLFGGLWIPLQAMPAWFGKIAVFMPSYHFGQLSQMLSGMQPFADVERHVSILVAMSLAALIGAWMAWRRQDA